jgi:serine/threonine protein kinase
MSDADSLTQNQLKKEKELILTRRVCQLKRQFKDVSDFRSEAIAKTLDERFYDANFLGKLMCALDTVLVLPAEGGEGLNAANETVREMFTDVRRIGAESVYGNAMMSSLDGVKDVFVIKTPKQKNPGEHEDELLHELFVGLMGINSMREICPNFAYIFGGFKCLPPAINNDKSVSSFCAAGRPQDYVNYVIYEKIPGKSMADLMKNCTFEEFFSWYIQIVLACYLGTESIDFTHYDLHNENVMLRGWKNAEEFAIPYVMPNGSTCYVRSNKIAMMIDFGMTHIQYNNESFGKFGMENWGTFPDQSRPFYDIYKLLGFCMSDMARQNNEECLNMCVDLQRAFVDIERKVRDEDIIDEVLKEAETFHIFSADRLENEDNLTLLDYLAQVKKFYPELYAQTVSFKAPNVPIITCGDTCPTPVRAEAEIGGTVASRVAKNLKVVKKAPKSKSGITALAQLPGQIKQLRAELSAMHESLYDQLENIHDMSSLAIPKVVDSERFQEILETYAEPNMNFRDQYSVYRNKQSLLQEYYRYTGDKVEASEFDFGVELSDWESNYSRIYHKLSNMIVPSPNQSTQDYILSMMSN